MSLSGYIGDSFRNTLYPTDGKKVENIHGTVAIGSFDFAYNGHNIVARGHFDYGHLSDAKAITDFNMSMSKIPSRNVSVWAVPPSRPVLRPVTTS